MLRIYLSHSIRGAKGNDATPEEIAHNCRKACDFTRLLREKVPNVEFYVPAEMDEFPDAAYTNGYLTIGELLLIDCEILYKRNAVLVYAPDSYISGGMWTEIRHAHRYHIPIYLVRTLGEAAETVNQLLMEMGQ